MYFYGCPRCWLCGLFSFRSTPPVNRNPWTSWLHSLPASAWLWWATKWTEWTSAPPSLQRNAFVSFSYRGRFWGHQSIFPRNLVPVDLKCADLILDVVRGKYKPAYPAVFVFSNRLLVVLCLDTPYGSLFDKKELLVVGGLLLDTFHAQDLLHAAVQGMVNFFSSSAALKLS